MRSYADSVREELLELTTKRPCCRKSLTMGLLFSAEAMEAVVAEYKNQATAELAAKELRHRLGKPPTMDKCSAYGHTKWQLRIDGSGAQKLWAELDRFSESEEKLQACEGCRAAFLRGTFLACATVNDPKKSTHLEFLLPREDRAEALRLFLMDIGYEPRITKRAGGVGLYFKDAASVEDLLALMGAVKMSMDIMNLRIEREIRNNENRATNCVAKNIEKSVSASAKQMDAIEKLTITGMLAQLPDSIRLTARLRAENPDASLEELRNLHNPPITKSGLNHRLQKILAAGAEARAAEEKQEKE